ncbi:hypothetical protein D6855_03715 [Butyrivibrio sp. CB08]|jgi:hypothetical protein|uniref:hypothetical protein n=1 Tax=Butyrivibrio sp. CB08 TaxID=2364879 RepID=UPI000EA996C6|nr:hypothetical protein [Butyrivibrio sp. CB08]RKM61015.1 hypothetical protein D6855_03715 [Butyrivibrio sp. CB08]
MENYRTLEDIQAYSAGYAAAVADMVERDAKRRKRQRAAAQRRKYFLIQRSVGLVLVAANVLAAYVLDGDITAAVFLVPLGIYLMLTKEQVLDI